METLVITNLIVNVLIFIGGLYLIFFKNYFAEKGKNLATKEDVEEITKKVESVKHEFHNLILKTNSLFERKIQAFDEVTNFLNEIQKYSFRERQESEYAVPYSDIPKKSPFQRAHGLMEMAEKHRIYLPKKTYDELTKFSQQIFNLGRAEMAMGNGINIDKKMYDEVITKLDKIIDEMKEDIFNAENS